jgi:predicted cupin superfamily sugar epimerase
MPRQRYSESLGETMIDDIASRTAAEIICLLDLRPHPEGGHFRETFRDPGQDSRGRAVLTLIYFLLEAGQLSRWHRVDATEVWHFYAGAPLELKISQNGVETSVPRLGPDLISGERPQFVVPAHCWQSAMSLGPWTLVGCSVAPGFEFSGFELAPPGWAPIRGKRISEESS